MTVAGRINYRTAVTILTGKDSEIVTRIDKVLGGAILASVAAVGPVPLSFIAPKNELKKLAEEKLGDLVTQLRGNSLPKRTQRINAAHAILVIDSFLSTTDSFLGSQWKNLKLTDTEIAALFTGERSTQQIPTALTEYVLSTGIPMPESMRSLQQTLEELRSFFTTVVGHLLGYLKGLEFWESLPEHMQLELRRALLNELPVDAVRTYLEDFRRLAADVPEFGVWANLQEHQATRNSLRDEIQRANISVSDIIESAQTSLSEGIKQLDDYMIDILRVLDGNCSRFRQALANVYQGNVTLPVLDPEEQHHSGVVAPPIEEMYQSPKFKVAEYGPKTDIAVESWWKSLDSRTDLDDFIRGYLLSPRAVELPLLLLGHPGAGKSMLTQILAARLPMAAFTVVRVPLRTVTPDASVHNQIEQALFDVLHEHLSYPQLVKEEDSSLPVILLDGFDELMQATGVRRSDYLETITEFQRLEHSQGRPVAVIVTSRTAVVDRARTPIGATIVKLEPFDREQVASWISVWNRYNRERFEDRKITLPTTSSIWKHSSLACQPILLLMLAVYDAANNDLQRETATLDGAALYERLIIKFIEREILKSVPVIDPEHVEREIFQLAVIALAMFNRGVQVASGEQLDTDLKALGLPESIGRPQERLSFSPHLSQAQVVLGQFFFVRSAEFSERNIIDGHVVSTGSGSSTLDSSFEFLHATFGEYLVARTAMMLLSQVKLEQPSSAPWRGSETVYDDGLLSTLYSFQSLCASSQIVVFLRELAAGKFATQASSLAEAIRVLLTIMPWKNLTDEFSYAPVRRDVPARYAYYSSNLVIVYTAVRRRFELSDVVPEGASVKSWFPRQLFLWQSGIEEQAWKGIVDVLQLDLDESGSPWMQLSTGPYLDSIRIDRILANFWNDDRDVHDAAGYAHDAAGLRYNVIDLSERYRYESRVRTFYPRSILDLCMETVSLLADGLGSSVARAYIHVGEPDAYSDADAGILGAAVFGALAYPEDGAIADGLLDKLYELGVNIIHSADMEVSFVSWLPLLRQLEVAGDRVSLKTVHLVLHQAYYVLHYAPLDDSDSLSYYGIICKIATRNISRSRVLNAAEKNIGSKLHNLALSAWRRLEMTHLIFEKPVEALELIMDVEQFGVSISSSKPGLGQLEDWFETVNLTSLSIAAPSTFVRIFKLTRMRRLDRWAGTVGIEVLRQVEGVVRDLLDPVDVAYLILCGVEVGKDKLDLRRWYFEEYGEPDLDAFGNQAFSWSEKTLWDDFGRFLRGDDLFGN